MAKGIKKMSDPSKNMCVCVRERERKRENSFMIGAGNF